MKIESTHHQAAKEYQHPFTKLLFAISTLALMSNFGYAGNLKSLGGSSASMSTEKALEKFTLSRDNISVVNLRKENNSSITNFNELPCRKESVSPLTVNIVYEIHGKNRILDQKRKDLIQNLSLIHI